MIYFKFYSAFKSAYFIKLISFVIFENFLLILIKEILDVKHDKNSVSSKGFCRYYVPS